MSGRVGDLSPKQKEALAKVSPQPGPGARPGCGRRPPQEAAGGGRGMLPAGEPRGGRRRRRRPSLAAAQPAAPPSLCPPGGPRKVWPPRPQPQAALAVAPGKKWLLGSPRRQLRAQRQHSSPGLAGTGSQAGTGAGPRVSSHFREVLLLRGQWLMEKALASSSGYSGSLCWTASLSATLGTAPSFSACSLGTAQGEAGAAVPRASPCQPQADPPRTPFSLSGDPSSSLAAQTSAQSQGLG